MGRQAKPSGESRTVTYRVRVRPEFDQVMQEALEMYRDLTKNKDLTISDLVRKALVKNYREQDDPRQP